MIGSTDAPNRDKLYALFAILGLFVIVGGVAVYFLVSAHLNRVAEERERNRGAVEAAKLAKAEAAKGDYEKCIEMASEQLKKYADYPKEAVVFLDLRAQCLNSCGDYEKALKDAGSVVEIAREEDLPGFIEAGLRQRVIALKNLERWEEAYVLMEELITFESDKAWFNYLLLGEAKSRRGDIIGALEAVDRATVLNPLEPDCFIMKGVILAEHNCHEEALEVFDTAFIMARDNCLAGYRNASWADLDTVHLLRGKSFMAVGNLYYARIDFLQVTTSGDPVIAAEANKLLEEVEIKTKAEEAGD